MSDIDNDLYEQANQIIQNGQDGLPQYVDPDVADAMGAFEENALSDEDALMSLFFDEDQADD